MNSFRIFIILLLLLTNNACHSQKKADTKTINLNSTKQKSENNNQNLNVISPENIKTMRDLFDLYSPNEGLNKNQIVTLFTKFFPSIVEIIKILLKDGDQLYTTNQFMELLYTLCPPFDWAQQKTISSKNDMQEALKIKFNSSHPIVLSEFQRLLNLKLFDSKNSPITLNQIKLIEVGILIGKFRNEIKSLNNSQIEDLSHRLSRTIIWNLLSGDTKVKPNEQDQELSYYILALQMDLLQKNSDLDSKSEIFNLTSKSIEESSKNHFHQTHQIMYSFFLFSDSRIAIFQQMDWLITLVTFEVLNNHSSADLDSLIIDIFPRRSDLLSTDDVKIMKDTKSNFLKSWNLAIFSEALLVKCPLTKKRSIQEVDTAILKVARKLLILNANKVDVDLCALFSQELG